MVRHPDLVSPGLPPRPATPPPTPPPAGGVKVTAEQQIRMAALAAAARLTAGTEPDRPDATYRDVEQTTVGMANRLAEWITDGAYDWMSAGKAGPDGG